MEYSVRYWTGKEWAEYHFKDKPSGYAAYDTARKLRQVFSAVEVWTEYHYGATEMETL